MKLKYADVRISDLELKLVLTTESLEKTESEKNILTQNGEELSRSKETISELSDSLKVKTTELCRSKMSEGKLQIEVNTLKTKLKSYEDKFEACVGKFKAEIERLFNDYQSCKADADSYVAIKSVLKSVFESDDTFCKHNLDGETFESLDEEEICEIVQKLILESFEAKVDRYKSMEQSYQQISDLKEKVEKKSSFILSLDEQMKIQRNVIGEHISRFNKAKLAIETLERENEELKKSKEAENEENLQVIANMKDELDQLEKFSEKLGEQNKKMIGRESETKTVLALLNRNMKEKNELVVQLKKEVEISDGKSNENLALIKDMKSELCKLEKLTENLEQKNELIVQLKKENENLKISEEKSNENSALLEDLKSELYKLEQLTETLEQKNEKLLSEESESLATIATLKKDVQDRDSTLQDLKEKVKTLEDLKLKVETLEETQPSAEILSENVDLKKKVDELKNENEKMLKKEEEVTNKMKELETELKNEVEKLKKEKEKMLQKDDEMTLSYFNKLKEFEIVQKDKERLIKTLQKNNDLIDSDLEKALKAKSAFEDEVVELKREMKKKEEDFFAALQKHSKNLNLMKTEVNIIIFTI